jgi:Tol biopolymer transport system component
MGEVYKARDTRLDRTVAIKVSTREFGERFQREAQAIASLNHPNICTLHDIGPDYLVMEYIEGVEIKGPLPIGEVLRLAMPVGDALNYAHRHGVIHRDLKPANLLVTKSGVKVLDFGLAKLNRADVALSDAPADLVPTLTQHAVTQKGMIVGTPRYMAPELLEGREPDARSDIWAFGLVLYEMITGVAAFEGKTRANLIAAILAGEPRPVTVFQPLIPPALERLIGTCLAKDPDDRLQNMHDLVLGLKWIVDSGSQAGIPKSVVAHRKRRERLSWLVATTVSAAALALGVVRLRETPAAVFPVRFEQPIPINNMLTWFDVPAVSPDGRSFAYTGVSAGAKPMLWLRHLDALQPTTLPGTENARLPFWSPNGRFIGYFAEGKLTKVDANGGSPQVLCDIPNAGGGSWSRDGLILIGETDGPIHEVLAAGGGPKALLKLDSARKETGQAWPHFLPDGRHFLYTSLNTLDPGKGGIYLASTDSRKSSLLLPGQSNANFVLPGLLVFGRGRLLMAQPFDPGKLRLAGAPFPAGESVGRSLVMSNSIFSSSPNGTLVYRSEIGTFGNLQPAWYDRNGKRLGSIGEPRAYWQGALSPDEKRFAVDVLDPKTGTRDIWLLDLGTGILSRLTSDPASKNTVEWSPDGREILFASNKSGSMSLYRKVVGGGDELLVHASSEDLFPAEWLNDGSFLYLNTGGKSFYRLASNAGAQPETLLKTEYSKDEPRVSPDGQWVAYHTNESGRWEVYIASFPGFTNRRQLSNNGGVPGYWRKDGKELFYLALDGNMISVPIKPGFPPEAGMPRVLFPTRVAVSPGWDQFAVTGDGQRFLMLETIETEAKPFTIVLNWPAGIKR